MHFAVGQSKDNWRGSQRTDGGGFQCLPATLLHTWRGDSLSLGGQLHTVGKLFMSSPRLAVGCSPQAHAGGAARSKNSTAASLCVAASLRTPDTMVQCSPGIKKSCISFLKNELRNGASLPGPTLSTLMPAPERGRGVRGQSPRDEIFDVFALKMAIF